MVNNYYRYGPNTSKATRNQIVNPTRQEKPPVDFGKFFVEGNYVDDAPDVTRNNFLGVRLGNKATDADKDRVEMRKPFDVLSIPAQKVTDAYASVLALAGCSLPARDTLDERIISDVKKRTGRIIDVQGGFPHGTPYEQTVNAWPKLKQAPAPVDSDKDGMPD